MLIGEVARRVGLAASTLRYYEREGLLPAPARAAKRRTYDATVLGRLRVIQLARSAGLSIAETRFFLGSDSTGSMPSTRWQALANRKLQDMDALIARANQMKRLLKSSFRCSCLTIQDCERFVRARPANRFPSRKALASIDTFKSSPIGSEMRKRFAKRAPARSASKIP